MCHMALTLWRVQHRSSLEMLVYSRVDDPRQTFSSALQHMQGQGVPAPCTPPQV